MAETPIGALAVRIGADASELINELKKADGAVDGFAAKVGVGVKAVGAFATAAAAAGAAVFAFAKHAADTADELGKLSQKVGVSVESLSALKYAGNLADVSLDQLRTGLTQLTRHMVENGEAGIAVEERLLRIADQFQQMPDGATKTALAMQYFGKSGADLIPMLNQGRAGLEEMRKEAERLGITISTEAAKAAEQFNDNLTRLEQAAQGLGRELAGPLVEAIGKAAQSMIDARKAGEGWISSLVEGFRTLVTGDDLHKWNVEFVKATDALLNAQQALDHARFQNAQSGGVVPFDVEQVKRFTEEVKRAQAEIDRLRAIKPILAPDSPLPVTITGGAGAEEPSDPLNAAKREQEIRDILHKVRIEDDARELEQIKRQNEEKFRQQEEAARARLEQIDWEQAEAIRRGEEFLAAERAQREREAAEDRGRLAAKRQFMSNMSGLMNTNSKTLFEIGKAFAIADALIKGHAAVMGAYAWGMKIGGPPVAAAFAAAAGIATLNMINNIRSQQFGGGGGAPTPAGQGSSGVAAAPAAAPPAASGGGQTTVINMQGDTFGRKQLRDLVDKINEGLRDGDRIVFAG